MSGRREGQRVMWTDMDFLVGADPGEVLPTAPSPVGEDERRTATVYRSVARRLSRADGVGRAQLLSLEAARFGWVWDLTTGREHGEPLNPLPPDRRPGRHHARRPRRRLTGGDDATVRATCTPTPGFAAPCASPTGYTA
ncbi:hypothetical protein ACFU8Q_07895 [Streptomyces sp. NPDC057543]|uniref:hypothetical protein n=1 Tax=Streptomyces sp. NPDC057543 TaxID=3346163 RepID=UPI00368CEED5